MQERLANGHNRRMDHCMCQNDIALLLHTCFADAKGTASLQLPTPLPWSASGHLRDNDTFDVFSTGGTCVSAFSLRTSLPPGATTSAAFFLRMLCQVNYAADQRQDPCVSTCTSLRTLAFYYLRSWSKLCFLRLTLAFCSEKCKSSSGRL